MPYPETLQGALDALEDMRIVANTYGDNAYDHATDAMVHWIMADYPAAIEDLIYAVQDAARGVENHAGIVEPFFPLSPTEWYLINDHKDLTWRSICEAWAENSFEGRAWTIACIDRMRTLIWDEPFDIQWAANPLKE